MENKEKETMVEVKNNGEQGPIADEKSKLIYRGWKTMPFVIGNETFEKLGAIGTLSNLLVYLTTVFHMSSIQAATIINIFNGTTNFSTVIGAFVSDTYWGRFKTIACASIASFMGLVMIDFTAIFKDLHPPSCGTQDRKLCKGPTGGQIAFLATGLGLLIVGAAGIRPCNFAFGADQFNPKTEAGKKGINSFFNWYFFTFTIAQMLSLTVIVYVQSNVSWSLGFGIPALLMLLSCVLFFMGAKLYVKVKASGSPMTSVAQVLVVAVKKRQLKPLDQPWPSLFVYMPPNSMNAKLPYTHQFRCLDKAAIVTPEDKINADGSAANPWRLCSMQQVEEMKCLVRVLPVWAAAVLYSVVIVQQHTYATFQALQSNRRLGNTTFQIPAATYYVFLMLAMTIWIPVYDRLLVPFLQKRTGIEGGITLLQRIGAGIVLSIVCMIISAIVEERRRSMALTKPLPVMTSKGAVSSMSGFWLVPQLTVAGIAEAFTAIGQVEFYYKQFPENMRSIGGSLFFCAMAGSSYVSSLLILIVHKTTEEAATGNWLPEDLNKGRLDYYYYMIAALGVLNFGYFLLIARWYQYKGTGIDDSTLEVEIAEKNAA